MTVSAQRENSNEPSFCWERNPGELGVQAARSLPPSTAPVGCSVSHQSIFFLTWKHVPLACNADSNTVLPNVRVVEDGDPTPRPTTVHPWARICHYLMPFRHADFLVCVLSRQGRSIWGDTLEVVSELLMHPETSSGTIKISWFFFSHRFLLYSSDWSWTCHVG